MFGKLGFSIDDRSLAAYRIVLGLIIVFDQLQRVGDTHIFLSDQGVWPRRIAERAINEWRWSLSFANGTAEFQYLVSAIIIIFAICMIVGWRVRFATAICWVLVASVHSRNPYILNGGDTFLRCLLFWSMFLPMSNAWCLAAAPPRVRRDKVPIACFVMQIFLVYVISGLWKTHDVWRESGDALSQALEITHLLRPFGEWMTQFEVLARYSTFLVVYLEMIGPLFLIVPFVGRYLRLPVCLLFVLFHLLSGMMMDLGLFPLVGVAAWVALLPSSVWERMTEGNERIACESDEKYAGIKRRWLENILSAMQLVIISMTIIWLASYMLKQSQWRTSLRPAMAALQLEQRWKMFAGRPGRKVEWLVCRTITPDGKEYDALNSSNRDLWAVPQYSHQAYPSEHWRKFLKSTMTANSDVRWNSLAVWLHRQVGTDCRLEIYVMRIYLIDDGTVDRHEPQLVYTLVPR